MSNKVFVAGVGMGSFTKPSQQYPYDVGPDRGSECLL